MELHWKVQAGLIPVPRLGAHAMPLGELVANAHNNLAVCWLSLRTFTSCKGFRSQPRRLCLRKFGLKEGLKSSMFHGGLRISCSADSCPGDAGK